MLNPNQPAVLLSLDVEEVFQIEAARTTVPQSQWQHLDSRIDIALTWLIQILDQYQAKATCFITGYVAEHHRQWVRKLADAGHEIACHSHAHRRLHDYTPDQLADDLQRSRKLLQDISGQTVHGFRAPTWSLTRQTAWAVDILIQTGFAWDSSIQPVAHPQYGIHNAPIDPCRLITPTGQTLPELPPLTLPMFKRNLPAGGGGYFRLFPLHIMHQAIRAAHKRNAPAVIYFHPWEFDPDQPPLPMNRLARFRTYVGIRRTRQRFQQILQRYRPSAISHWLNLQNTELWPQFQI